ncbi:MAG: tetratricopeptide repeat protein [Chloroherpetonaceae bacterium]|nr:tetratricopeptide repeat protein [Chloroherpetonaceae bacterium]
MTTFLLRKGGALTLLVVGLASGCLRQNEAEYWHALDLQAARASLPDAFLSTADAYFQFYERHPNSPRAPYALFKSAQMRLSAQKPQQALQHFELLYARYPTSQEGAQALFMMAYIQHNYLDDTATARLLYARFLERYPTHSLAESARFELQHLGQPADQLFSPDTSTSLLPSGISVSIISPPK